VQPPLRVVLDRMQVWKGSRSAPVQLQTIEDYVAEVHRAYGEAPLVYDPFQAVGLAQRLQARGVRVVEFAFSATSVGRLGLTLHSLIRDGRLAIPDDPELIDELANVRLRETSPGIVRLDHDSGRHDDRAVTLALAARHLLDGPAQAKPSSRTLVGDPLDAWEREWRAREARGSRSGHDLLTMGL
jgi:phage terminase large subunit-like protein